MKKLFFLLSVFSFGIHAQDTIRFRNGEVKAVKVKEVGVNEIRYNRYENVGGPTYITTKNDVRYIKYSVGEIDSFPIVKTEVKQIEQPRDSKPRFGFFNCDKLTMNKKNQVLCSGYPLGEANFKLTLLGLPEGEKKTNILKAHAEMKDYKKKQYQYGFGGLIVFLAAYTVGFFVTEISVLYGDFTVVPLVVGITVGAVAAIAGAIISKDYKQKRMGKRYQIVKMYNDEFNFQK